jgi:D-sedoheptulose 7-phosphate isomerase
MSTSQAVRAQDSVGPAFTSMSKLNGIVGLSAYLEDFNSLMNKVDAREVDAFIAAVTEAYVQGKFVFVIGNGGSGANASHLCEDLGKGTLNHFDNQKRLKIMSLTDNTPYILAWGNDVSYESVFVEQLKNFAEPGALLIAISGSGNSPNIIAAIEWANAHGMKTIGVTGYDGGKLRKVAQQPLHVPSFNMGAVEAAHSVIFHYALDVLYQQFKKLALPSPTAK